MIEMTETDFVNESEPANGGVAAAPEYRLVLACLRRAIEDAVIKVPRSASEATKERYLRCRQDALDWLDSSNHQAWSAQWCADITGLNLEKIRRFVREAPAEVQHSLAYQRKYVA